MELIDKAAVVAEIERRKGMCDNHYGDYWNGCYNTFTDTLSFIDTLEVKEVDLNVELANYNREYVDENGFFNTEHLAKYFFELGLKVKNK